MSSIDDALREREKDGYREGLADAQREVMAILNDYADRWNAEVEQARDLVPDYGDLMEWYASRSEVGTGLMARDIADRLRKMKEELDE